MASDGTTAHAIRGEEFALHRGLRDSRDAFARWRETPGPVLRVWFGGAFVVSLSLLLAVWVVSLAITPDLSFIYIPGVFDGPRIEDVLGILGGNSLVLALHATACVAGFIAGSSLKHVALQKQGLSRWVHEKAGPIAIGWVVLVTGFSLFVQALGLGFAGATIARSLDIGTWQLIVTVLPHALIELTAIFLPLAAWLVASRRDQWEDLLAATIVTVTIAIPMLIASALIELTLWPYLLREVSPVV